MSPYAKFGLDRPSHSAGHRQQTDRQTTYRLLLCRFGRIRGTSAYNHGLYESTFTYLLSYLLPGGGNIVAIDRCDDFRKRFVRATVVTIVAAPMAPGILHSPCGTID